MRESAHGRGIREERSTINFGGVQVWTLATCAPGECFINFAIPLWIVIVTNVMIKSWLIFVTEPPKMVVRCHDD